MKRPAALPEAMAADDAVVSLPAAPLAAETVEGASPAEAAPGADVDTAKPKAKAKVKAKSTVKAKAASKAKAAASKAPGVTQSAKKEVQKKLKRPAAAVPPEAPKGKAKAKAKTVKEMTEGWKKERDEKGPDDHAEGEEEEPREQDEACEDETRSYPKARKWARLIKAGQVPEDLQQLYEQGAKNSPHPRLFKSQFINKVFQQNSKGEYVLAPGNAQFEVFKKNAEIRSNRSQVTGLPYSIMLWKNFHGNEEALHDAERRGDVYQKDGYYHFKSVATAIEKRHDTSMVLHGGRADLSKDEYSQMNEFMASRPWSQFGIGGSPSSTQAVVTRSSSSLPKAICDAPLKLSWSSVEHDIKEAKGAQERLGRDCQRLAAKIFDKKDEGINQTLKDILSGLSQRESMLGQCIIFQSVEGTNMEKTKVEKFFRDLGQATEDANEKLESTKSIARTRGWLDSK